MGGKARGEERDGVALTNLDDPLFPDAGATKRDLVDYLDAGSRRMVAAMRDRPLSVIRILRGQDAFMQKNVPKYTPEWVPTISMWAESSQRQVRYAMCNDRRTLLWFGNQRAVEYHPALVRADAWDRPTHLIMDLDPPEGGGFDVVVRAAHLVRQVLDEVGLTGVVKTSGSKGLHIYTPILAGHEDAAAATRAVAARAERLDPALATTAFIREDREGKVFLDATRSGGATVASVYSPRNRPGVPVSYPVAWADLDSVTPRDFTIHTATALLGDRDPWSEWMPEPRPLDDDLVAEGHTIPIARVQAMHEGKRRKRAAARAAGDGAEDGDGPGRVAGPEGADK